MKFKIGFNYDSYEHNAPNKNTESTTLLDPAIVSVPRKSVVQVHFPSRGSTLAYYNDRFDLHIGNLVYVDGKLEGQQGRITEINYNFKIKLSDYKRIIAVIDTTVKGQFYFAGSHFITFTPYTIPSSKVRHWFKVPAKEEDEFVCGDDDTTFRLDDLQSMKISAVIAERGHDYYIDNRVRYISVDGSHGYAIIEGGDTYEVEFEYQKGEISHLICSCFCSYHCKHEFATMLQLRETLNLINKHYASQYEETGYFAAICKGTLFNFAVDSKETGTFSLG